ncbi:MAG: acetyl-CoA hydrolase [Clostridiales Family XIII bacterium]|jgi:acyl-CoA hydrolase|nr:acetyl-CoA hydrolase [Clostridiales Family XIII bacterium]
MSNAISQYKSKLRSPEEAVKIVESGDWVDYCAGANFPELLDKALAERRDELVDVKVRGGLVSAPRIEIVERDLEQKTFTYHSWHMYAYERKLADRGICHYIPVSLPHMPHYYRSGNITVDVAFIPVSVMDEKGYFGLGLSNAGNHAVLKAARKVVFEVNERYPELKGENGSHRVHVSEADFIVEGAHSPLPTQRYAEPSPEEAVIAGRVVELLEDGSVLALGVGSVPFAVASLLAESDLRDLACHTGTISDAFLKMRKAGKLTNARKELHRGKSVWNLASGSEELYEWISEDVDMLPQPVDYVNDPATLSRMERVVSVNGGIEIDLYGQENGESNGIRHLSGTGGQLGFLTGAFLSKGGKGFVCLPSVFTAKDGARKSAIVPLLKKGSVVTAPRAMMQYVATEYGVANLAGLATWQRAEALISLAHPDFREELTSEAQAMGIWRRSNRR